MDVHESNNNISVAHSSCKPKGPKFCSEPVSEKIISCPINLNRKRGSLWLHLSLIQGKI